MGASSLTVWGWFTAALLSLIAFSVPLAAILLLLCDRHAGTSFFLPTGDLVNGVIHKGGDGSPLLWLHLFWFFGHPEVYIAILPGLGLTSMLLANFSHRKVFAYRTMITTTLLIGLLGILLWGHHMFVAGLNPFASSAFSISTIAIALPASAKVLSWLATIWRSRPQYTPMLSPRLLPSSSPEASPAPCAQPILDQYLHNTFLSSPLPPHHGDGRRLLYAATYYWFPLITATHHPGRLMSGTPRPFPLLVHRRRLRLPPHALNWARRRPRHSQLTGTPARRLPHRPLLAQTIPLNLHIIAAIFLSAQLAFL
jgi:cytochrome c oxidase subunit 1